MDFDTKGKFDENSLIIQVEGNVSAGKEEFAKILAEELGMVYFPQPDLESYYVNDHGFDYRALNPLLPERLRLCDWEMFHENPSRHSLIHLQYYLFKLRLNTFYKALRHVFNTGQGVVMTRTVFTERAMVEAMHNVGWLPKGYLRGDGVRFYDWKHRHNYIRNLALSALLKPHLCIYLDTPVGLCLDRVRKDPNPMLANSNAHTREFLEEIESAFKNVVLAKQEHNMHVLMVDNPKPKTRDEVCDIIDDLTPLKFEYDPHDTRFSDWDPLSRSKFWFWNRRRFTTRIAGDEINYNMEQSWFDIAGMGDCVTDADLKLRDLLYTSHVGTLGYLQEFDTDAKVHGLARQIIGYWPNYGIRQERSVRTDFI